MADDSSEIVKEMAEAVAGTNVKTVGEGPAFFQNMGYQNAVAGTNVKTVGEGPAFFQNMGYQNAVAHQQAMSQIQLATVGKVVELIVNTSPTEGGVDVAALQQLLKGAQTTPPVTP